MNIKHYMNLNYDIVGSTVIVKVSQKDGFGPYSVRISDGVLYATYKGHVIVASSSFIFQEIK